MQFFFISSIEIIGLRTETVSCHDNKGNTIAKSRVLNLQTGHTSRVGAHVTDRIL